MQKKLGQNSLGIGLNLTENGKPKASPRVIVQELYYGQQRSPSLR
ncbi:hypothetical protein [Fischerella sp.]|nr:hypothetical protein [Fischerella sp.]